MLIDHGIVEDKYRECLEGGAFRTQCYLGDRARASRILETIHSNLERLILYVNSKYPSSSMYRLFIDRMMRGYRSEAIQETHPLKPGETSYVVGNGDIFSLCIRHIEGGNYEYHDINTLMFVSIHELSHIGADDISHEEIFWKVFRWLLLNASEAGVYNPVDYKHNPVMYCNKIEINYSPLFNGYWDM